MFVLNVKNIHVDPTAATHELQQNTFTTALEAKAPEGWGGGNLGQLPTLLELKMMTSYAVPVENTLHVLLTSSAFASNTLKLSLKR